MVKHSNNLIEHIKNYADEGNDIIFDQDFHDFHDEILDTMLEEERKISSI